MTSLIITLMFWVTSCALTEACPVWAYEVQYFDNMAQCDQVKDVWQGITPDHVGVCLPEKIPTWEELPDWEPVQ